MLLRAISALKPGIIDRKDLYYDVILRDKIVCLLSYIEVRVGVKKY